MSPAQIFSLFAAGWLFLVVVVAIDALAPLLVGPPPPRTGRKVLRLSVLIAGLLIVLRVAISVGGQS